MTSLETAARAALEALKEAADGLDWCAVKGRMMSDGLSKYAAMWKKHTRAAIAALEAALAEPAADYEDEAAERAARMLADKEPAHD